MLYVQVSGKILMYCRNQEPIYMRPKVRSDWFKISNCFEKSFRLHGNSTTTNLEISNPIQKLFRLHDDFTAAAFQTIVRFYR